MNLLTSCLRFSHKLCTSEVLLFVLCWPLLIRNVLELFLGVLKFFTELISTDFFLQILEIQTYLDIRIVICSHSFLSSWLRVVYNTVPLTARLENGFLFSHEY